MPSRWWNLNRVQLNYRRANRAIRGSPHRSTPDSMRCFVLRLNRCRTWADTVTNAWGRAKTNYSGVWPHCGFAVNDVAAELRPRRTGRRRIGKTPSNASLPKRGRDARQNNAATDETCASQSHQQSPATTPSHCGPRPITTANSSRPASQNNPTTIKAAISAVGKRAAKPLLGCAIGASASDPFWFADANRVIAWSSPSASRMISLGAAATRISDERSANSLCKSNFRARFTCAASMARIAALAG